MAGNLQGLFEGTLTVRLQQGIAAQAAVMALEFARAGITGARDSAEVTRTPGHPDYPLGEAALRAKFLSCARRLGPARSQDLLDAVAHLDELDDMAQIARLTVPS